MLRSIVDYFRTSKEELEKVAWPSKEDTLRYSILIVAGSVAAAVFFGALDFGLGKVVQVVINSRNTQTTTAPTATGESNATESNVQVSPGTIEAVDSNGKPVQLDINPTPIDAPIAPSNP